MTLEGMATSGENMIIVAALRKEFKVIRRDDNAFSILTFLWCVDFPQVVMSEMSKSRLRILR